MVQNHVYARAVKASEDLINWAIKNYPLFESEGIPQILATFVTAAIIFRESGYTWYEQSKDKAFVPRHIFREKYPMVHFNRSQFLISMYKGPISFYAVKERYVELMGNSRYYLPTIDELKQLIKIYGGFRRVVPLLIIPTNNDTLRKILEVQFDGGFAKQA